VAKTLSTSYCCIMKVFRVGFETEEMEKEDVFGEEKI
jgi:hypothetical protein